MNRHNNHVDVNVNHVNDINQLNVVSDNKFANSSTFQPHLVKLKAKTVNLLVTTTSLLSKPYARFIFVAIVTILVSAVDTFALKDLKGVVNDFKGFLYGNIYFALCVTGFAFGGFRLTVSKSSDDKKQGFFVLLIVIFLWFFPSFLKILKF